MALVQIDWNPDARKLRQFGLILIAGFGILGAAFWLGWPFAESRGVAVGLWIAGGGAALLGLTGTTVALPVYWAWMAIAFVSGNIVSRVVMGLFYYGMITPMGLVMRVIGKDRLGLRDRGGESYWSDVDHPTDRDRYARQF